MIIEILEEDSIVRWKYNTNEQWKCAEISDLIAAFEKRPQDKPICPKCALYDYAEDEYCQYAGECTAFITRCKYFKEKK